MEYSTRALQAYVTHIQEQSQRMHDALDDCDALLNPQHAENKMAGTYALISSLLHAAMTAENVYY